MKKRRILYSGILAALAGLLLTGFAYGYRSLYSPEERINHFREKLTKELNLDTAQQQVLEEIIAAFKEKIIALHDRHKQTHGRVIALFKQDQVTSEDVMDLVAEHRQKFDGMAAFAAEQFVRFHDVLTAEQREQLAQHIEERALKARHCRFRQ